MKPSWLTVPNAKMRLRSNWRSARQPPEIIVTRPIDSTIGRHRPCSANAGEKRATR